MSKQQKKNDTIYGGSGYWWGRSRAFRLNGLEHREVRHRAGGNQIRVAGLLPTQRLRVKTTKKKKGGSA